MLKYNFKYELKLLLRSRWIQLLSLTLLLLFAFSAYNGKQKVEKRISVINDALLEEEESDVMMLALIDSVNQGLDVSVPRWTVPTSPTAIGNYYPRVASMEVQPLALIATGQSDLFTPYVKPRISGDDFALNFTEMTSPVQLLFGSFDLAFVIVFLLPLLIIAFSYNVLSAEKESGSLRLLASQPIGIQRWLLQKLALRFMWLSLLVVASLTIVFLLLGIEFLSEAGAFFSLLGLTLAYMLFWFALAFLINLWVGTSAKNAVSLLGLWVIFVLLVPSVLNQLGNSLYPIPSRTLMINEMRTKKTEVSKKQDEILDNYLRDHPEYAINDTTETRSFWHRYMASQKLVREELAPVVNTYESQLQRQQDLTKNMQWLSPALTIQESLNSLAGTSSADYDHYRKQVVAFAENWRDHLLPYLYNNQEITMDDIVELPAFQFQKRPVSMTATILPIILLSAGVFILGLIVARNLYKGQKLIHS